MRKTKKVLKVATSLLSGIFLASSITGNIYANNKVSFVEIMPNNEDIYFAVEEKGEDLVNIKLSAKKDVENISLRFVIDNKLSTLEFPNSIKIIENAAFFNNNISNLTIPSGVKDIENNVFRMNKLENVKIPDTIHSIKEGAFHENKIKSVVISKNITNTNGFDSYVDIKFN